MTLDTDRDHILVSTSWLADHLDDPSIHILDCRYYFDGRDAEAIYRAGHVPGAVRLDWSRDLSDPHAEVEGMVAPPEQVEATFSRLGVDDSTLIVTYDDEGGHFGARVWLVLARYGRADRLRILDGGWTKWVAEGRPVTTAVPEVTPGRFTLDPAHGHPELIASLADVEAARARGDAVILDVRRWSEYTGEEARARHGGHIPGAVPMFWQNNLNWEGDRTFLPPAAIRARHEGRGITPDMPVITYCQGGVRASNAALALLMAGYRNVRVYDGSWAEWGNRDDVPIERGGSPA